MPMVTVTAALLVADLAMAVCVGTGTPRGAPRLAAIPHGVALVRVGGPAGPVTPPPAPSDSTLDPIGGAVVLDNDRTVVVDSAWGDNPHRPWLVMTTQSSQVTLAVVQPPMPPGPGNLVGYWGPLEGTVDAPVGARPLVNASTGQPVPTVHEQAMARVTVLPTGYRFSAIAPGTMIGLVNGEPAAAGVRIYLDAEGGGAPLQVAQFAGTAAAEGVTYLGPEQPAEVDGSAAIFQAQENAGTALVTSLSWSEDGWVFVLSSWPSSGGQLPLGEGELVTVADGMHPFEWGPTDPTSSW